MAYKELTEGEVTHMSLPELTQHRKDAEVYLDQARALVTKLERSLVLVRGELTRREREYDQG